MKVEGTDTKAEPYHLFSSLRDHWLGGLLVLTLLASVWVLSIALVASCAVWVLLSAMSSWSLLVSAAVFGVLCLPLATDHRFVRWVESFDRGVKQYFDGLELVTDKALQKEDFASEGCLYCFHPHGILSIGFGMNGCWSPRFRDLVGGRAIFLIASQLYHCPGFALLKNLCGGDRGNFQPAEAYNMSRLMQKRHNLAIIPGGFEEATLMQRGRDKVFLKERKGFVKFALRHGYKLFPVYTFNEDQTFNSFPYLLSLRLRLASLKLPAAFPFGNPFVPWVPRRRAKVISVVGKPVECPKIDNPTLEDVNTWHQMYVDRLQQVYEDNKQRCGHDDSRVLEVL